MGETANLITMRERSSVGSNDHPLKQCSNTAIRK
jgi:hypothetical protein